jgi:hypothetical protein
MQRYQSNNMIIINHYYKVVNLIHKVIIQPNMELKLLHLDSAIKPLPISEGVAEIRIKSQPCKGNNLTTLHTWATKAPQVATVYDTIKESSRVLLRPSAVFHVSASADNPWVARILSHITFISEVRYHPTQ